MAVTLDILRAWRDPRAVIREKLPGASEASALAVLMTAAALAFVAQWPGLARAAHLDATVPLQARLGGALMAVLFVLPLLAYGLALVSHVVARALGGRGSGLGARLALFWALLALTPAQLLLGLMAGFVGAGAGVTLLGGLALAGFFWIWLAMLVEVERGDAP